MDPTDLDCRRNARISPMGTNAASDVNRIAELMPPKKNAKQARTVPYLAELFCWSPSSSCSVLMGGRNHEKDCFGQIRNT